MPEAAAADAPVAPFRGEIVRADSAAEVISPAFDSMSESERRAFRAAHPHSYLHVTRSAVDEPDAATVDNETLARRGRASLDALVEQGRFDSPGGPGYYVYRLVEGTHAQCGVVCEVDVTHHRLAAKPHEATKPERTQVLADHFRIVRASSSPIACAVRDDGGLERELNAVTRTEPVLDHTGTDGVQQTVWRVNDPESHTRIAERLSDEALYIIDGHHRSAALHRLSDQGLPMPVLSAVFPAQSLRLVGFHRLLHRPADFDVLEFLHRIGRRFHVEPIAPTSSVEPGHIVLVADDSWFAVHFDERPVGNGALIHLGALDPVVLEREVLGIAASMGPVDVTYTPDTAPFPVIVERARAQERLPMFVAPVTIEDMMVVADGGLIMPPKSTYFTPKVRSGVFLRRFDF